jgi:hypothetical protein
MTEKFREFLANAMRFDPEEKREQIVADAEGMMTDFIRAKVDPTKDLVPLCVNCHAMIHRHMAAEKGLEGAAALAKLKGCLKK